MDGVPVIVRDLTLAGSPLLFDAFDPLPKGSRSMPKAESEAGSDRGHWCAGQRVSRRDDRESGTIVEISRAAIKVKWDDGRTSYYRSNVPGDVKLKKPSSRATP
jgi:hypothetical protein